MTENDLVKGHVYRAKKPRPVRVNFLREDFNDRMILFIGPISVQYDSPTVKDGRRYPSISIAEFLEWAGSDVTEGYPEGDWAQFEKAKK